MAILLIIMQGNKKQKGLKMAQKNIQTNRSIKTRRLIQMLQENNNHPQEQNISNIIEMRNHQSAQFLKDQSKLIWQVSLKPGSSVPRIFSSSKPINTGDPYLDQKKKSKILFSERAFTRKPNSNPSTIVVVTGVTRRRPAKESQEQKKDWISRKFADYDQAVTEQSGPLRILYRNKQQRGLNQKKKKPIYSAKYPTTLFSTFQSNNLDFYESFSGNKQNVISRKSRINTEPQLLAEMTCRKFPNLPLMKVMNKAETSNIHRLKTEMG